MRVSNLSHQGRTGPLHSYLDATKYVYYLIALSVASIGFTVTQTTGKPISLIQIPLGIALVSWATSITLGLLFMHEIMKEMNRGIMRFDKALGTPNSNVAERKTNPNRMFWWQTYLFGAGVVGFIIWHVLEMCSITS